MGSREAELAGIVLPDASSPSFPHTFGDQWYGVVPAARGEEGNGGGIRERKQ